MKARSTAVALALVLALCVSLVAPAMAAPGKPEKPLVPGDTAGAPTTTYLVQPEYFPGNMVCGDFSAEWIHAKFNVGDEVDGFANGAFDVEGGTISISKFDGKYFDFSATMPIDAVFVKAGNGGNLFRYDAPDGPKTSVEGLHGPVAPNGQVREVSHVSFCWDLEATTQTAFAYGGGTNALDGDTTTCFENLGDISRWGWSMGAISEGSYTWDLYAGAAQCDLSKGTKVGTVTVVYDDREAIVTYDMFEGYRLGNTHVYVGSAPLPLDKKGDPTVAPGQYPYTGNDTSYTATGLSGSIYVIAHAEVSGAF